MNEQQIKTMTKLAEEAAALAIESQIAAQRIVLTELLDTLKKQSVLSNETIFGMIVRLDAMAATLAKTAPATAEALADTTLSLGDALGKDSRANN